MFWLRHGGESMAGWRLWCMGLFGTSHDNGQPRPESLRKEVSAYACISTKTGSMRMARRVGSRCDTPGPPCWLKADISQIWEISKMSDFSRNTESLGLPAA